MKSFIRENDDNSLRVNVDEIASYKNFVKNPELIKDKILAITKSDMLDDELKADIEKDLPNIPHIFISSVAEQGLVELKDLIWTKLND